MGDGLEACLVGKGGFEAISSLIAGTMSGTRPHTIGERSCHTNTGNSELSLLIGLAIAGHVRDLRRLTLGLQLMPTLLEARNKSAQVPVYPDTSHSLQLHSQLSLTSRRQYGCPSRRWRCRRREPPSGWTSLLLPRRHTSSRLSMFPRSRRKHVLLCQPHLHEQRAVPLA